MNQILKTVRVGHCVSCDTETQVHEICIKCAIKLGQDNPRWISVNDSIAEANELREQIKQLTKDKERLDWIERMMTPDNDYIEVYFAGLRDFKTGKANSFQIESNPWDKQFTTF